MAEEEQQTEEINESQTEEATEKSKEEEKPEIPNIVTIEDAGPCKKKVLIEIPEEKIKNSIDDQYKELQRDAIVPGFRKGRAPRRLLEKRFGKEASESIKLKLLAQASESAIKDNELKALGEPDIDFEKIELPEEGSLKFDFLVEVQPEFELPELEGIPVTKTKLEVTDEQIDGEIEQIRKWAGVWTPRKDEAAELDDQIIADAILKIEDVEEEEKLDNIEIYVRQNGFVGQIPVEKLDELLIGAKAGESKQTSIDVPKTFYKEEYRGKKIDLNIEIKDIKWLKPAELNESLFQRVGVGNESELREKTHDKLQKQQQNKLQKQQLNVKKPL